MKLAWFSPFHNSCGPGFMSHAVVRSLCDYAEVGVFYHPNEEEPFSLPGASLTEITSELDLRQVARDFDAIIYNLGNNEENHQYILQALRQQPGIVVLHDYVMQHALVSDIFVRKEQPDLYYWLLVRYYGRDGACAAQEAYALQRQRSERVGFWDSAAIQRFPLFETVAQLATACVVHSHFFENKLRAVFPGPVLNTRIPCDLKKIPPPAVIDSFYAVRQRTSAPVTFACFGHISPSKCIDQVIRAFGASAYLRQHARLLICGGVSATYGRYLEQLHTLNHLAGVVELRGRISDTELYALQVEADAFINLRHPNTEGQSASLIEQMASGKPVLCFNSGCFADLPDDAACKVDDPHDLAELTATLEQLAQDPQRRQAIGRRGRRHALSHDSAGYARDLFEFVFEHRTYLKALQLGTAPDAGSMTAQQQSTLHAHLDTLAQGRDTWSVLGQRHAPLSQAAFEMLPSAAQPGFRAFLEHRDQPLHQALAAILDAVPGDDTMDTDPARFPGAVSSTPLLDTDFWDSLADAPVGEFVQACYRKLLCRPANPAELKGYVRAIEADGLGRRELLRIMLMSDEARERFKPDGERHAEFLQWCEQ